VFSGYLFGLAAAMCYGSSLLVARQAFLHAPGASTAAGGCLAYTAATLFFSLILLKPSAWGDIKCLGPLARGRDQSGQVQLASAAAAVRTAAGYIWLASGRATAQPTDGRVGVCGSDGQRFRSATLGSGSVGMIGFV
jgi:hypothetical protein